MSTPAHSMNIKSDCVCFSPNLRVYALHKCPMRSQSGNINQSDEKARLTSRTNGRPSFERMTSHKKFASSKTRLSTPLPARFFL